MDRAESLDLHQSHSRVSRQSTRVHLSCRRCLLSEMHCLHPSIGDRLSARGESAVRRCERTGHDYHTLHHSTTDHCCELLFLDVQQRFEHDGWRLIDELQHEFDDSILRLLHRQCIRIVFVERGIHSAYPDLCSPRTEFTRAKSRHVDFVTSAGQLSGLGRYLILSDSKSLPFGSTVSCMVSSVDHHCVAITDDSFDRSLPGEDERLGQAIHLVQYGRDVRLCAGFASTARCCLPLSTR